MQLVLPTALSRMEVSCIEYKPKQAATDQDTVKFVASTGKPVPIGFQQSYTQTPVFVPGIVNNDSTAPDSGFKFINQAKAASAVV